MMPSRIKRLRGSLLLVILCWSVPCVWAQSPVVTYVPQPAGLFGLQTVYRPVISYPSSPVVYSAPVTAYRVSPPVVVSPPITVAYAARVAPARVVTGYAPPWVPGPVFTQVAPAPLARPWVRHWVPPVVVMPSPGWAPVVSHYPPMAVGP